MDPKKVRTIIIFPLLLLFGCADFNPHKINDPKRFEDTGKTRRTTPQSPEYKEVSGLSPSKTLPEAIDDTEVYSIHYGKVSTDLYTQAYGSSETQFLGAITAAVGGIIESTATAVTGVGVTTGASIYSERYQLELQASNYQRASNAFRCMNIELTLSAPKISFPNADLAGVNKQIEALRRKLREAQASVSLTMPDATKIGKAMDDEEKARKAAKKSTKKAQTPVESEAGKVPPNVAMLSFAQGKRASLTPPTLSLVSQAEQDEMTALLASLDKCITEF